MGWAVELLKSSETKASERDLSHYRKCNFIRIHQQFSEEVAENESEMIRGEYKGLLKLLNKINNDTWNIAKIRRSRTRLGEMKTKRLYSLIWNTLMNLRYLHKRLHVLIQMEKPIWQETTIDTLSSYDISKEEVYRILPYTDMAKVERLYKNLLNPVLNSLKTIENNLVSNEVLEDKLREFEEMMLIDILPYFEDVYKDMLKLQEEVIG